MKKFLIGPITGIMEKRKNLIAQQFKDAETVQNQAQEMKTQYETALSGAKEESVQIIADARSDAKALGERTLKEANEKASRILEMQEILLNRKNKMQCQVQNVRLQIWLWKLQRNCLVREAAKRATVCYMTSS